MTDLETAVLCPSHRYGTWPWHAAEASVCAWTGAQGPVRAILYFEKHCNAVVLQETNFIFVSV